MKPRFDAIVAGLGYAGLSTLLHLKDAGLDNVLGLEPRAEPGGRASSNTRLLPGTVIDEGPEFVGKNHSMVLALAKRFGVGLRPMTDYEGPFSPVLQGDGLDSSDCAAVNSELLRLAHQLIDEAAHVNLSRPWASPRAHELDNASVADWLRRQPVSEACRKAFEIQVVANHGVTLDRLSLLGFLLLIKAHGLHDYLSDTEVYRLQGGAQELPRRMGRHLGQHTRFRTAVTAVDWQESEALVTLSTGETIRTPHFVLTAPPSVWHLIRFTPELPPQTAVQMGMSAKVFVVLAGHERFEAGLSPHALHGTGDLQLIWDATEGQTADSELGSRMVITGFSGGEQALRLSDLKHEELQAFVLRELKDVVPRMEQRLLEVRCRPWPRETHTLAGYSAPDRGQVCGHWPKLVSGLGPLHFAGEYLAQRWAFMDGAACSGAGVAGKILRAMGVGAATKWEELEAHHFMTN